MGKFWILFTGALVFAVVLIAGGGSPSQARAYQAATVTPVASGTPHATGTISVTATTAPTVAGQPTFVPTVVVQSGIYQPGGGPFAFAHSAFQRVWDRTDGPVKQGQVSRTWFWGPGPNTPGLFEQYNESPLGNKQRLVQYFDKSRMEVNNPNGNQNDAFFVTNGLLTVELISGYIQVGEKDFLKFHPACIPMSGDFGDTTAPTYFAFQGVSNTQAGDHPAPNRTGQKATESIDRNGKVGSDASKGTVAGVDFVHYEAQTKHNIPKVFWDFLNSSGPVHDANGKVVQQQLISPWFFASGLPISEPYWAKARIQGVETDVLIQAYERRALTYVPTNQAGFRVEMANIGQHYFDWRYRNAGVCPGTPAGTPTAPVPVGTVPAGTGTPVVTGTPSGTVTAVATGTPCRSCPTETATATFVLATASVVPAVSSTPTHTPTAKPSPLATGTP